MESKEERKKKRKEFIKKAKESNWEKERIDKSLAYLDKLEFLQEDATKRSEFFKDFTLPAWKNQIIPVAEAGSEDVSDGGETTSSYNGEVDLSEVDFSVIPEGKKRAFVEKLAPAAVTAYKEFNILPSLMFGQGALESAWGASHIDNGLFGIKATGPANQWWKGNSKTTSTTEDYGSGLQRVNQGFRVYENVYDSCMDFARMLGTASHYSGVPKAKNYSQALTAVKAGGYATDRNYVSKVTSIIKPNNLDFLDNPKYKDLATNSGGSPKNGTGGKGKGKKIKSQAEKLLKGKSKSTSKEFLKSCLNSGTGKSFDSISSVYKNTTEFKDVSQSNLMAGDVVFFSFSTKQDVAGIFIGDGKAIICKNKKAPEKVNITKGDYKKNLESKAKRVKT